jgi:hypothetical protein
MTQTPSGLSSSRVVAGRTSLREALGEIRSASAHISIGTEIWSKRFFNRIKHCRRIATRYDKQAANFLAFVKLAAIRLWLRVNESTA